MVDTKNHAALGSKLIPESLSEVKEPGVAAWSRVTLPAVNNSGDNMQTRDANTIKQVELINKRRVFDAYLAVVDDVVNAHELATKHVEYHDRNHDEVPDSKIDWVEYYMDLGFDPVDAHFLAESEIRRANNPGDQ